MSLAPSLLIAGGVKFFDGGIDYWHEAKPKPKVVQEVDPISKPESKENLPSQNGSFDWKKIMDPKNDEFFKEGDYVPPAPFMEVARNPSDENIRMWHTYIQRKNELAARLQARLQEYALRNGLPPAMSDSQDLAQEREVSSAEKEDPERYQFRMYFDSQCPHCKKMMQTMADLSAKGFAVEAKQTDEGAFDKRDFPFSFSQASQEELKRHGISSVPFLLIADLKDKVVFKMAGYKEVNEIFAEVKRGVKR